MNGSPERPFFFDAPLSDRISPSGFFPKSLSKNPMSDDPAFPVQAWNENACFGAPVPLHGQSCVHQFRKDAPAYGGALFRIANFIVWTECQIQSFAPNRTLEILPVVEAVAED